MDIAERIRRLREAKGLSQGDIQKRTGLLRCYISRVENGHTIPSLRTLEKLATALDVEPWELLSTGKGKAELAKAPKKPPLTREQQALLAAFDSMSEPDRRLLLYLARQMARTGRQK
jgi:transcriptional regulator with XRE-family HTH domain